MKKNRIFLNFLILILFTVIMLVTCKPLVSLGATIDVLPPSGQILYPDAGDTPIKGSFVLKGTAKDDDGVQSVQVVFENIETKQRSIVYEAVDFTKGSSSVLWTINVTNESTGEEPGHELVKVYPIPDGEYTAIVSVIDNGGKTSTFTKNYKIDNTAPVFIVSRPSTFAALSENPTSADKYGAVFSVLGQAGERNTVAKLSVEVPEKNLAASEMFVGKNINAQLFVHGEAEAAAWYNYQKNELHNQAIKAQLFLYDNAQEFTGGAPGTEGNKSDFFYLKDDIQNTVLAKGYTEEVISDYFAGKKGSDKNKHDKKIKELRADNDALTALKNNRKMMDGTDEKRSTFKLDPNKSPGYKIIGVKNLAKDGLDLAAASTIVFKSGNASTLLAELIPNKDGTPLVSPATVDDYKNSGIKIVLMKWDGASGTNETDSFKSGNNLVQEAVLFDFAGLNSQADLDNAIIKEGSNLRVKFNLPTSFTEGKRAIKVIGMDSSKQTSNTFEAYDDSNSVNNGLYICNFISSGSGPRIRPVRIEGFKNQNFDILADITDLEPGTAYYKIGSDATEDSNRKLERPDPVGAPARYKATLDISGLTDGEYELHFLAKANNGSQDKDKITFTVDKTPPTVALTYPESNVAQAGEVSFTGTISDAGAGVKASATKFLIAKKSIGTVTPETSGWQNMVTSTAGSWNFKYNFTSITPSEYGNANTSIPAYFDIPIYILAEDNIGNKKVHKLTMLLNPDGRKPVVKIFSPANEARLGGTIQIFGTTNVAIGSPSDIGEAYIQFSKTGNFDATPDDGKFGTKDWYNGGNGIVVDDTAANGAVQWTQTINQDQSFNPSGNNWFVYFRVRAKNKTTNEFGAWTEKIKIEIDKSSPTIGSPDAIKIVNSTAVPPVSLDYIPRMWIGSNMTLTGSLYDETGIKEITISGDLANGKIYTGSTAIEDLKHDGWIEEDPAHPSSSPAAKNYKLKMPLNLSTLTAQAQAKGEFSVKISITENTYNKLKSEREFTFRFDTDNPSGGFGNMLYVANGTFGTTSITNSALANTIRANPSGLKILVGDEIVNITGISGIMHNTVNFAPALASAGRYNYAVYRPEILVKAVSGNDWVVRGVANDNGSGVKEVTAKLEVGSASQSVTMTELDPSNKIYRQLDGLCKWEGKIDLSSIPDGKGKLTYTITDNSGNVFTAQEDVRVKNKALRVTTVKLSTDIGGTQSTFENTNANNALVETIDANSDAFLTLTSKRFAFKSLTDSKIKVDFTGGQGQIKYTLKYNGNTLTGHNMNNISSGDTIALTSSDLNTIGNSTGSNTKDLVLELWDSAEGCTKTGSAPLTKSSFAEVTIKAIFDALDTQKPTVVVLPFHWNGEGDNSLYQNSRANGHVEIAKINSLGNDHSSVSGKVTLRGFAYDNIKINTVKATLPHTTLTATRPTSGAWTNGSMTADGAVLTIEKLGADYLGYYIQWTLDWDTERTSVDLAKEIKITVNDGTNDSLGTKEHMPASATTVIRNRQNSAQGTVFTGKNAGQFVVFTNGETQYLTRIKEIDGDKVTLDEMVPVEANQVFVYGYNANEAKTNVNIMPFITEVETGLMSADSGFKGSFSRASTGEYPVRAGESLKIKGFNLNTGTVMLGSTSLGTNLNNVSIASSHTSDEISVQVGSRKSINNMVDVSKPYNIEGNGINNDILNAKRKLFVWKMEPIINNNAMESPQFVMDKDSTFYMSLGSLGGSAPMKFFMLKNQRLNGISDMNSSAYAYENTHSKFHNTVVGYDEAGNIYGGSTNTDKGGGDTTSFNFVAKQKPDELSNYGPGRGKRRLEGSLNQNRSGGEIYDVSRVQIPKVAIRGNGTDADKARIALAYYDRNNDNPPIKFRYGTVGSNSYTSMAKGLGYDLSASGDCSAKGYEIVAQTTGTGTYRSGLYVGVGLLKKSATEDRAIVAWYDSANSALMYSFKDFNKASYTAPANSADSANAITSWQNNAVRVDGAAPLFIDLVVDNDSGVHIGYYSSGEGGVKYAYLPPDKVKGSTKPNAADFKVVKVDTYMNPGTYLKIGVRKEGTKQVPYISYYHNGFYGSKNAARIAWLKDGIASATDVKNGVENGKFTGNWVVMTVPASNGIQQYTICQGVPTGGIYQDKVIAAYFTNANYEMAVLKK